MIDDHELLRRIAAGDKSAMRTFFMRYRKPLFGFIKSRGANNEAADDAVQDAMLDVWRKASSFTGRANAQTWLFTIARNKMVDQQRKTARLSVVEDVPETVDDTPDAEQVLISAGDGDRVRQCLGKLNAAHLSAIRLAFYEELNYAQIGEIEQVPQGTIKTRIYHAKKLLMKCLGRR